MREYWILCRLQLTSLFGVNKLRFGRDEQEKKKRRREILLVLVVGFAFINMSVTYSLAMASVLNPMNAMPALLSVMMTASSIMMLILTVFQAKTVLVTFGDYDTVYSWPVRANVVAASRITTLYVYNLLFMLMLLVPAGAIYAIYVRPAWWYYPLFLLLTLLSPSIPTFVGGLLGVGIARLSAGRKRKNLLNTAAQLVLFVGVMAVSMQMNTFIEGLQSAAASLQGKFETVYPPSVLFTNAVTDGSLPALLMFLLLSAGMIALMILWLSRRTPALWAKITTGYRERNYHYHKQERSGIVAALFRSELKRYFASSTYVINTLVGPVMLLVAAAALLLKREAVMSVLPQLPQLVQLLPYAGGFFAVMSCTTSSSISIEGKRLWIVKSLPVRAKDWFWGKLLVNFVVILPVTILCTALISIILGLRGLQAVWLVVLPAAYAVFTAVAGLALNLKIYKLDWKNDVEVVKQSTATMLVVFSSFVLAGIPVGLTLSTQSPWIATATAVLLLAGALYLWKAICRSGDKKMLMLNE